jgi:hypothetical protein
LQKQLSSDIGGAIVAFSKVRKPTWQNPVLSRTAKAKAFAWWPAFLKG